MYECPITKYISDIQEQIDEQIEEQLMIGIKRSIGFDINKDELIKALKYDREQYSKGYKDGKIEMLEKVKQVREENQGELFIMAETRYMKGFNDAINICLRNLDKLIAESET